MSTRPEQDGEVFFLSIPFHPLCYSNVTPSCSKVYARVSHKLRDPGGDVLAVGEYRRGPIAAARQSRSGVEGEVYGLASLQLFPRDLHGNLPERPGADAASGHAGLPRRVWQEVGVRAADT